MASTFSLLPNKTFSDVQLQRNTQRRIAVENGHLVTPLTRDGARAGGYTFYLDQLPVIAFAYACAVDGSGNRGVAGSFKMGTSTQAPTMAVRYAPGIVTFQATGPDGVERAPTVIRGAELDALGRAIDYALSGES